MLCWIQVDIGMPRHGTCAHVADDKQQEFREWAMLKLMRVLLAGLFVVTIGLPTSAGATLIDHGSYVSDTATNLDWYKVTNTQGQTYQEVQASLTSSLTGWQFASLRQLNVLLTEAGLPLVTASFLHSYVEPEIRAGIQNLEGFLGNTFDIPGYMPIWDGMIGFYGSPYFDSVSGSQRASLLFLFNEWHDYNQAFVASNENIGLQVRDPLYGSFLVRESMTAIPEPTSLALLAVALAGLGATRSRKQA